ncbi:MAG: hypothetical protein WEA81_04100 [Dehalococcoidia bacterium]
MAVGPDPLAALWDWLATWIAPDGGVNGPVVHRSDLKRLFALHDTPWTQQAVIDGLLHLHRRSGRDYWLGQAVRLADAQCSRQEANGRFRWAGHEDDRFSALVHNALAASALLHVSAALDEGADASRRDRYAKAAERNLEEYAIGKLYRPGLCGFAMNPTDHYAGRDRFIVNMNSVAVEALVELDRARGSDRHTALVRTIGERLQEGEGLLPYSDVEPEEHISLYVGLALRGLPALATVTGDGVWTEPARRALRFLDAMEDEITGLWFHKVEHGRLHRFPVFVAGAGMICNGILDAAPLAGSAVDADNLARRLLRFQYRNGAIRNFVGYDHPDNGRRRGNGTESWEDVYPTPNWNAQAFHFLCRVLPPPNPPMSPARRHAHASSGRYLFLDTPSTSIVVGLRPLKTAVAVLVVKRLRHALVVPGPQTVVRWMRGRMGRG